MKHVFLYSIFLILWGFPHEEVVCQSGFDNISSQLVEEKIILSTDRSLYVVDEYLSFKADYFTLRPLGDIQWSTVLYLELIDANGEAVAKEKYPLETTGCFGSLKIPSQLVSGQYFLKAYTRWMRNFPVEDYAFYSLKIINPYREEVLEITEEKESNNRISVSKTPTDNELIIQTDKKVYGKREKLGLSLKLRDNTSESFYQREHNWSFSVSVVKKGTAIVSGGAEARIEEEDEQLSVAFLPEISGISFSGKITDLAGQDLPGAWVDLVLLNHKSTYLQVTTDQQGKYQFTLPNIEGTYDFCLSARKGDQKISIKKDPDFCSRPVFLEMEAFNLSETEMELAKELSINHQLTSRFTPEVSDTEDPDDTLRISFYGKPDKVIFTSDFVNLPYVEEFLFEIVPEVLVRKMDGKRTIVPTDWNLYGSYPYLLLVDNIPVWNHSALLDLRTNSIERFELVKGGYIIGDARFSGILNVFSKDQNVGGITLPKSTEFGKYSLYAPQPDAFNWETSQRLPDRRNSLYWNPDPKIIQNQSTQLSFTTSDLEGTYQIIVKRVNRENGETAYSVAEFVVE